MVNIHTELERRLFKYKGTNLAKLPEIFSLRKYLRSFIMNPIVERYDNRNSRRNKDKKIDNIKHCKI